MKLNKTRQALAAGLLACTTLFMAVVFGLAQAAGATNIDVSQQNLCRDNSQWLMTFHAHNTHDAPLDIRLDTSQGPGSVHTLAPNQSYDTSFVGSSGSFTFTWSSTNGHLVGQTSGTFTRPEGCAPATTVPEPTTAAPVDSSIPEPTAPAVSVATTAVLPAPPMPSAPVASVVVDKPVAPQAQPRASTPRRLPASCFVQANCPVEHTSGGIQLVALLGGAAIGTVIVAVLFLVTRKRSTN